MAIRPVPDARIQNRANAIRPYETHNMEAAMNNVPPGCKQTEVGVIPEDWDAVSLGSLTVLMTNGFVGTVTRHYADNENGVLYIQGYNVEENSFNFHGIKYVNHDFHKAHAKSCLRGGDLLTVQAGDVGLTTMVPESLAGSNYHALIISRFDKKAASSGFFSYYLNSSPGRSRLRLIETGTTMKHLNVGDMLEFLVPLPPTKAEQEAIAEALSDTDALIESLEQLITKKRHLKQGTMQELLTGNKRLPGFQVKSGYKQTEVGVIPEDWNVKLLPEVCRFRGGKAHEQFISELGQYVCVNSKFVSTEGNVRKYSTANFCCANQDDVLMVMSDLPNGKALAKAFIADQDDLYAVNQRVCALTAYTDSPKFLFYLLNRNPYFLKFDNGVSPTHLLNNVFAACSVLLPPTKAEQTAIATILSDMDSEITTLETKLAKTRQLKQGMMHNLLTGRIRLV